MKRYLFLIGSAVAIALYSCNLQDASPVPPQQQPSQKADPYRGDYARNRVNLNFDSGVIDVIPSSVPIVLSVNFSNSTNKTTMSLGGVGTANVNSAIISLVHAENGIIQKNTDGTTSWRLTFPQYSATDTLSQPYVKAIVIDDDHQTITDYRAYLAGTDAKLDYTSSSLPGNLTVADMIGIFKINGMKVTISQ